MSGTGAGWGEIRDYPTRRAIQQLSAEIDALKGVRGAKPALSQAQWGIFDLLSPEIMRFTRAKGVPTGSDQLNTLIWPDPDNDPTGNSGRYLIYYDTTTEAYAALKPEDGLGGGGGSLTDTFFHAYADAETTLGANTWTKISLNKELYDPAGVWDTTNKKMTAPSGDSIWLFIGWVFTYASGDGQRSGYALYKNGSVVCKPFLFPTGANLSKSAPFVAFVKLTTGDYIEPYAYADASVNTYNNGDSAHTVLQGFRLI